MPLLPLHLNKKLDCSKYIINLDIIADISTVFQSQLHFLSINVAEKLQNKMLVVMENVLVIY